MNKRFSKVELICSVVFFISALICGAWFFLYVYFATPTISLNGEPEVVLKLGEVYEDQGATATLENIDISDRVKIDNKIDYKHIGDYTITYSVTNMKGKKEVSVYRDIKIREDIKPVIKLKGDSTYYVQYASTYSEPGYTATDNYDGIITDKVKVEGTVNTREFGSYKIYYTVSDSSGNSATVTRVVKVIDSTKPKISLSGKSSMVIDVGGPYNEPGYTATDNYDGDITGKVSVSGSINLNVPGVYTLTYSVKDSHGNSTYVYRSVQVGTQSDIDNANYIYVSISDQKLWYYKNGVLQLSTSVVTGTRGVHDTPRGSYRIYGKTAGTYLIGDDYKTWVNYWMPFYGGYGLHDAVWRSNFGGSIYVSNGSHGCVNLPYWAAESIYYSAPVGLLVRIG